MNLNLHFTDINRLPMFFATWATFFAAAIISYTVQIFGQKKTLSVIDFINYCFPFHLWKSKSAFIDIVLYIGSKITTKSYRFFIPVLTTIVSVAIQNVIGLLIPSFEAVTPTYWSLVLMSVAIFVVMDLANYITHYMQHYVPILWELHKVHHSAIFLSPITTERMHPLGDMFDAVVAAVMVGVPMGICGFVFHLSVTDMVLLQITANTVGTVLVLDALRHSHFPASFGKLDYVLLSPHMHQLHHSSKLEHWDRNFGNKLSVFDHLFGTARMPKPNEELVFGLGTVENDDYNSPTGVYIGPLAKIHRLFVGRLAAKFGAIGDPSGPFFRGVLWRDKYAVKAYAAASPCLQTRLPSAEKQQALDRPSVEA